MSYLNEQENINDMAKNSIQELIKRRSLYILKKKFEIYKNQISQIYNEYKQRSLNLTVIPTNNIYDVISNIMKICQFLPISSNNFNELITADLMTSSSRKKSEYYIKDICEFTKNKITEYNHIFYERKIKEIQIKKEIDLLNKDDEIEKVISKYDKRGNLIISNEEIKKNNIEFEVEGMIYIVNEDDMEILNSNRFLYCELISLIISEYIEKHDNISLVSINDELNNELGTLFDSDIMKKISYLEKYDPKEELNGKIKAFLFEEMNVEQQIKIFEDILYEKNQNRENTDYIMDMIHKLKSKRVMLQNNITNLKNYIKTNKLDAQLLNNINSNDNKAIKVKKSNISIFSSKPTKEQLRKNALKEIFYFYSKQHNTINSSINTFLDFENKTENLNLSEFLKFCVEFKVLVKRDELIKIFQKTSHDYRNLFLEEFLIIIPKLAEAVNEEKIKNIESRIKLCKLRLKEIEEEKKKNIKTEEKGIQDNENKIIEKENEENEENKKEEEKKEENENNENGNNENENNENENNNNIEEVKDNQVLEISIKNKINIENNSVEVKEKIEKEETTKKEIKEDIKSIEKVDVIGKKTDVSKKIYKKGNKIITKTTTTVTTIVKKKSLLLYTREELIETISKYYEQLEILRKKSSEQLIEEFYLYLEIDFVKLYRKKMIGFILPFGSHEVQDYRFPKKTNEQIQKLSKDKEKYAKEKKEILERKYEEKEIEKKLKEEKEKKILNLQKKKEVNENMKLIKIKNSNLKKEKSYIKILKNKKEYETGKVDKVSWNELEKYNYNDFVSNTQESQKINESQITNQKKNNTINKKQKANINDYHINVLFNNNDNDNLNLIDDEDQELLNHLIGKQRNKTNKNINKYTIDASLSNNDLSAEIANQKRDHQNKSNIINQSSLISYEEKKEGKYKNLVNNLVLHTKNNTNIAKQFDKIRLSKKI